MIKKIGNCSAFQIECVHEAFPGSEGHVFGRMCLRFGEYVLGDFDEPACMLDVTAGHVEDILQMLPEHDAPELSALTDDQLWEQLDSALYGDDDRTIAQIVADGERYGRFDFLTNGGESFDHSKSFFLAGADDVRVLFKHDDQAVVGTRVGRTVFVETLQAWLAWFDHEYQRAKAARRVH